MAFCIRFEDWLEGISNYLQWKVWIVDFSSIVRHSPSHGQWQNARPLSGIRVDLVRDQIGLDRAQTDLVKDQVVPVRD